MLCSVVAIYAQQIDRKAIYGTWYVAGIAGDSIIMHEDSVEQFVRFYEKTKRTSIPNYVLTKEDSLNAVTQLKNMLFAQINVTLTFTNKGRVSLTDNGKKMEEQFELTDDNNIYLKDKGVGMCILQLNKTQLVLAMGCSDRSKVNEIIYFKKRKK